MSLQDDVKAALGEQFVIERELGGGGMAMVFLAFERALGRRVVIKVVRPELAEGVSAARFRREVSFIARLQHPHIVPMLHTGQIGSRVYYTMPFIEGETLRERLRRSGELAVPDVLRILGELSSALAYAHRQGIVHRDIKPENILLADGIATLADFGIAKLVADARTDAGAPVTTLTEAGIAVGTPAYMAPEQVAADPNVDQRADLYSLGCVAYEMLTGRTPFIEPTAQQMLAAHARQTPVPLLERRPNAPAALATLVAQLLEKRPADRPASAEAIQLALAGLATTPTGTAAWSVGAAPMTSFGRALPWGVAALTLVVAMLPWSGRPTERNHPVALVHTLPLGYDQGQSTNFSRVAISPDGRQFAFIGRRRGEPAAVMLRAFDRPEATVVPGSEEVSQFTFARDGRSLLVSTREGVRTVDLAGGGATTVFDSASNMGVTDLRDGTVLLSGGGTAGRLVRRPRARGAAPVVLASPDGERGEQSYRHPQELDDGRILLTIDRFDLRHEIGVLDPGDSIPRVVLEDAMHARMLSRDVMVFARRNQLFATRVDRRTLVPVGPSVPMMDGVSVFAGNATANFNVSPRGDLIVARGRSSGQALAADAVAAEGTADESRLLWRRRDGRERAVALPPRRYERAKVSPRSDDEIAVLIEEATGFRHLWLADARRGTLVRISPGSVVDFAWTPDGRSLLFKSTDLSHWIRSSTLASDAREVLPRTSGFARIGLPTPDGSGMIDRVDAALRILKFRSPGDSTTPARLSWIDLPAWAAAFSPDARFLTYLRGSNERQELFVRAYPEGGPEVVVSTDGAVFPIVWRDKEIIYRQEVGGDAIVAVPATDEGGLRIGVPTIVHRLGGDVFEDVSRDGSEFLLRRFVTPTTGSERVEVTVILNWIAEVRRRLDEAERGR